MESLIVAIIAGIIVGLVLRYVFGIGKATKKTNSIKNENSSKSINTIEQVGGKNEIME